MLTKELIQCQEKAKQFKGDLIPGDCLDMMTMTKLKHTAIAKGGQGHSEDDVIEAAMSTLLVIIFGCMLMVGYYIITLISQKGINTSSLGL